ncbi:MAG: biotin/lipoyl-binding protein, partial [Blastocatellia bacterium]|nr:biotin/lipoyl-binding protein [Blastocatellia bacterium]
MNSKSPAEPRESSSIIRIICLLACLFIVLAPASLLLTACSKSKAEKEGRGEGVPVTTGVVLQKNVPLELRAIGTVEAFSVVAVKSQVGGELTKVHFTEGQFVKKDDVLFTIDPRPYEATLSQAEANLARSRASEKQAEANLARDMAQAKNAAVQADRYTKLL